MCTDAIWVYLNDELSTLSSNAVRKARALKIAGRKTHCVGYCRDCHGSRANLHMIVMLQQLCIMQNTDQNDQQSQTTTRFMFLALA